MLHSLRNLALAVCLVAAPAGCTTWNATQETSRRLTLPTMTEDTVVLEIDFVQLPVDADEIEESIWREVDQQHLPADVRRTLAANGLRCGVVGSQLPAPLEELMRREANSRSIEELVELLSSGKPSSRSHMHSRAGKPQRIATGGTRDQAEIDYLEEDRQEKFACRRAVCHLAITSYPQGSGRAKLRVTPEIDHGLPRQVYVGRDTDFHREIRQQRKTFDWLTIEATLAPGESLVVSCTSDSSGLGALFFSEDRDGRPQRKLLVIRLAQTQLDDRFAPEPVFTPANSPAESLVE